MVLSVLFVSCNKDEDITKPKICDTPITFLKVGAEWEYGHYFNHSDSFSYSIKERIVSDTSNYYNVVWFTETQEHYSHSYQIIENDLWYRDSEWIPFFKLLPQNIYVGLKWGELFSGGQFEILSINETVNVPAGTFYGCIKIKRNDYGPWGIYTEYHLIHKDIGHILFETNYHLPHTIKKLHSTNLQ